MSNENKEQFLKLLQLVREAEVSDQALREEYQIGDKFRFIRDRIHALAVSIEDHAAVLHQEEQKRIVVVGEDELPVYVYLFNAHGATMQSWHKMVSPTVFYEHSVNRPIYTEKTDIDIYIRGKQNRMHHGYLTIIVKKTDILSSGSETKDSLGGVLVKVREGSLKFEKFNGFTHNGYEYELDSAGILIKKS